MRIRSSLLVTARALAATAVATVRGLAVKGGTESAQPYSFMGSLQRPDEPNLSPKGGHACGVMLANADSPCGSTGYVDSAWSKALAQRMTAWTRLWAPVRA